MTRSRRANHTAITVRSPDFVLKSDPAVRATRPPGRGIAPTGRDDAPDPFTHPAWPAQGKEVVVDLGTRDADASSDHVERQVGLDASRLGLIAARLVEMATRDGVLSEMEIPQ
jgi:hypothetical protein